MSTTKVTVEIVRSVSVSTTSLMVQGFMAQKLGLTTGMKVMVRRHDRKVGLTVETGKPQDTLKEKGHLWVSPEVVQYLRGIDAMSIEIETPDLLVEAEEEKKEEVKEPQKESEVVKAVAVETATFAMPIGKGRYVLTTAGVKLVEELSDGQPKLIVDKDGRVLCILDRNDICVSRFKLEGKPIVTLRDGGKNALTALEKGITVYDVRQLREAHKHLTRSGVVRGMDGLGHAGKFLGMYEVAINKAMAKELGVVDGQHMMLTRIPQGSGSAALVEVVVRVVSRSRGIKMSPALALLLGGDFDSDRYYLYLMNIVVIDDMKPLVEETAKNVLVGAENPAILLNLPEFKSSKGYDDMMKEAERAAVGPFTTMGYLLSQLCREIGLLDQYWPSQELIFDLRKLDNLGLNVSVELMDIMTLPLRSRYQALEVFANKVVTVLKAGGHKLDAFYLDAFQDLAKASIEAARLVDEFIRVVEKYYRGKVELTVEEFKILKNVVYVEPKAVPNFKQVSEMLRGTPACWKGNRNILTNILAKEKGEDEEIITNITIEDPSPIVDVLFSDSPELQEDAYMPYPQKMIVRGGLRSPLAWIKFDGSLDLVYRYMYRQEVRTDTVISFEIDMPYAVEGVPTVSGKLMTGLIYQDKFLKKVVNAYVDDKPYGPAKWLMECIDRALRAEFGSNEYLLGGGYFHQGTQSDLFKAIYAAKREWLRFATIARNDQSDLAYQLKAINFASTPDAEMQAKLDALIGEGWEVRSTKNPEKAYIMPKAENTELYKHAMHLWYAADQYSDLLPYNRVNREQLPAQHRGASMINVLVFDQVGHTYSPIASSYDALKMHKGLEFEAGKSASDSAVLFGALPYYKERSVQIEGADQYLWEVHNATAAGWEVEFEDRSMKFLDELTGEPMLLTDGEYETKTAIVGTLRCYKWQMMHPEHAYKMMVGPGAKGMYDIVPGEVTALVNGSPLHIHAAVSALSLRGKGALQAVLNGSARLLGRDDLPADGEVHAALHSAQGADSDGRYPVFVDGEQVGYFTILTVPCWVLPASTEDSGSKVGNMPWVAPLAAHMSKFIDVIAPMSNKVAYAKAMLATIASDCKSAMTEICRKNKTTFTARDLGIFQMSQVQKMFGTIFEHVVCGDPREDATE